MKSHSIWFASDLQVGTLSLPVAEHERTEKKWEENYLTIRRANFLSISALSAFFDCANMVWFGDYVSCSLSQTNYAQQHTRYCETRPPSFVFASHQERGSCLGDKKVECRQEEKMYCTGLLLVVRLPPC